MASGCRQSTADAADLHRLGKKEGQGRFGALADDKLRIDQRMEYNTRIQRVKGGDAIAARLEGHLPALATALLGEPVSANDQGGDGELQRHGDSRGTVIYPGLGAQQPL